MIGLLAEKEKRCNRRINNRKREILVCDSTTNTDVELSRQEAGAKQPNWIQTPVASTPPIDDCSLFSLISRPRIITSSLSLHWVERVEVVEGMYEWRLRLR